MPKQVVTGEHPSFDGLLAVWIATRFVKEWKGAEIIFVKSDAEADRLGAEGALVLNCGSGEFSGHPHDKYPNDCASTLFAKKCGLMDDPKLRRLLRVAVVSDNHTLSEILQGLPQEFSDLEDFALTSMPANIKLLYGAGYSSADALKWTLVYFYAEWENQRQFQEAVSEFKQSTIQQVPAGEWNRPCSIAIIESDNGKLQKVAQSKHGGKQALLFQVHSSGNWAIFSFRGPLDDAVAIIRYEEMKKRGISSAQCTREYLMSDGSIPEVPHIYHHRKGEQIFNGSLTHPDAEPSVLGREEIWSLVQIGINTDKVAAYWRQNP